MMTPEGRMTVAIIVLGLFGAWCFWPVLAAGGRLVWRGMTWMTGGPRKVPVRPIAPPHIHPFIRTYTGHIVFVDQPEQAEAQDAIHIKDIAWALAHTCRFGGHTNEFYSVGQHCCIVSDLVGGIYALRALVHDAPEYVMGDLVGPLKRTAAIQPIWKDLERRWERCIERTFLRPLSHVGSVYSPSEYRVEVNKIIKARDILVLGREMTDLMPFGEQDALGLGYTTDARPEHIMKIVPWTPLKAYMEFLRRYRSLQEVY